MSFCGLRFLMFDMGRERTCKTIIGILIIGSNTSFSMGIGIVYFL